MISSDLPIKEFSEDLLNRGYFARHLAETLLKYSSSNSFAIGLYGKWGSGKTSLLNLILEQIESENSEVVILRFNPWLCSEPRQLIVQFFKQLSSAIQLKRTAADQVWSLIGQYGDILDAAGAVPIWGSIIAGAGKTITAGAKRFVDRRENDLQRRKNLIIEKMTGEHLKIIVTIDDIDRLSEKEIIAVFQLVKALADFPNTIYLLAFDYDVVIKALSEVQHGDGKEYLEKIIQVPFEIPSPDIDSIHKALFAKLDIILGDISEESWDKETWVELYQCGLKPYINTMRDVIRFANVFSLKYELLKEETNPVELLGLTCLQVFEPSIYSLLPNFKDVLCGGNPSFSSYEYENKENEKVRYAVGEIIKNSSAPENEKRIEHILHILFPRTHVYSSESTLASRYYSHRDFLLRNSISVSACFDRYFSLTLEDHAIPTATMRRLVYEASESEFSEELQRLYRTNKIIRFLEEIEAYANQTSSLTIPQERIPIILRCLSREWGSFIVKEEGFFSVPFEWRFLFCVDPLLESLEQNERYACIKSIFEDELVQPSTLSLLLNDFENKHGRFTEKDKSDKYNDNSIFTLDELTELEQVFITRAVQGIDSRTVLTQHSGLNFLWLFERIAPDLAEAKKAELVSDDISLAKIISLCTSHGKVAVRIVSAIWKTDIKAISKYINADAAYERMIHFVSTTAFQSLDEDERMDVTAFLLTMEAVQENDGEEKQWGEKAIRNRLKDFLTLNDQTETI